MREKVMKNTASFMLISLLLASISAGAMGGRGCRRQKRVFVLHLEHHRHSDTGSRCYNRLHLPQHELRRAGHAGGTIPLVTSGAACPAPLQPCRRGAV